MREEDIPTCDVCGVELEWAQCWQCGGEGFHDLYDEDPFWYDEDDFETCDECHGSGGFLTCPAAKQHEEVLAERRGKVYYALWQLNKRLDPVVRQIHGAAFRFWWRTGATGRMLRARWSLLRANVAYIGWRGILRPVEICGDCKKVCRVLFWFVGDHGQCFLPF